MILQDMTDPHAEGFDGRGPVSALVSYVVVGVGMIASVFPFAGITQIRFNGCDLRPPEQARAFPATTPRHLQCTCRGAPSQGLLQARDVSARQGVSLRQPPAASVCRDPVFQPVGHGSQAVGERFFPAAPVPDGHRCPQARQPVEQESLPAGMSATSVNRFRGRNGKNKAKNVVRFSIFTSRWSVPARKALLVGIPAETAVLCKVMSSILWDLAEDGIGDPRAILRRGHRVGLGEENLVLPRVAEK